MITKWLQDEIVYQLICSPIINNILITLFSKTKENKILYLSLTLFGIHFMLILNKYA
jgi:hypothetical protein